MSWKRLTEQRCQYILILSGGGYVCIFVWLILPAAIFLYFYHDSADTFSLPSCTVDNEHYSAMGRPLIGAALCLMNLLVAQPSNFWVYRIFGAIMLGAIAWVLFMQAYRHAGRSRAEALLQNSPRLALPALIVSLPGSLLQVLHFQALPFVFAVFAIVASIEFAFAQLRSAPQTRGWIVPSASVLVLPLFALTMTCFIYQASVQIFFVSAMILLYFADSASFMRDVRALILLLSAFVVSALTYYALQSYLSAHGYFIYDPHSFDLAQRQLGDHKIGLHLNRLFSKDFMKFVLFGTFQYALKTWFYDANLPAEPSSLLVALLLITSSILRALEVRRAGAMSFKFALPIVFVGSTLCIYGAVFIVLLIFPATNAVHFARYIWFQSAVIVVAGVYVLDKIINYASASWPVRSWAFALIAAFVLMFEREYMLYARILPNHREYEFVRSILSRDVDTNTAAVIVIRPNQSHGPIPDLGTPITDEFHTVTSFFDSVLGLINIVARDVIPSRSFALFNPNPQGDEGKIDDAVINAVLARLAPQIASHKVVVVDFRRLWPSWSSIPDVLETKKPNLPTTITLSATLATEKMTGPNYYPLLILGKSGEADAIGLRFNHNQLLFRIDQWGLSLVDFAIPASGPNITVVVDYLKNEIEIQSGAQTYRRQLIFLESAFDPSVAVARNTIGVTTMLLGDNSDILVRSTILPSP